MSTRSAVGALRVSSTDNVFRGRYVHYDGYPIGLGPVLQQLVNRDGLAKVLKTICEDHYGWSSLDPSVTPDTVTGRGDGFEVVPGYGTAYTTANALSGGGAREGHWIEQGDLFIEWLYALGERGIDVIKPVIAGRDADGDIVYRDEMVAWVAYDAPPEMWSVVEQKGGELLEQSRSLLGDEE